MMILKWSIYSLDGVRRNRNPVVVCTSMCMCVDRQSMQANRLTKDGYVVWLEYL